MTEKAGINLSDQLELVQRDARTLLNNTGSLLLYISEDSIVYYHVDTAVSDKLVVGQGPYVKPLVQHYQFNHDFELLVLSQDEARLFSVGLNHFEEITENDWPISLTDALGEEKVGGELTHGTYGSRGTAAEQTYHGHNETSQEKEIDRENFFRYVDTHLVENHGNQPSPGLVLFALTENQAAFRGISKYQGLLEQGIEASGAQLSDLDIAEAAKAFAKESANRQEVDVLERFKETGPEFRIDNHLEDLANVAHEGRIDEVVISSDLTQEGSISTDGRFDGESGNFVKQIIHRVIDSSGKVYILSPDKLGEDVQISARLRY
ncbi:baeRF6 domain-containing protein [Streptococcus moroccensis]|uniref:Bacterial archaeo-eukaryotic release factor family 6 domain-containing protein n=1 Tax=Streptococcus moroccensis TaxID=1451356 RepID=A0ABT9YTD1_9STRE|nr:hypothetical protein [Streptococcus moroccensis]MDQ0222861.1 hypothetical protein [Streptococcus moroccensis]